MKRIFTVPLIVVMILFMASGVFAVSPQTDPETDWERYASIFLAGAHARKVTTDIFTWGGDTTANLNGVDTLVSPWFQRSWSDMATTKAAISAEYDANKKISVFGPNLTSLVLRLYEVDAGDVIQIDKVYFETALDTTLVALQNIGGSNVCVLDGNALLPSYDNWIWEEITTADSAGYIIPLRIWDGDWFRIGIISTTGVDTVKVDADIIERRAGG